MRCAHWVGPGISMATRFAFWRKIDEAALAEKHAQPGLLSDFILGSQDGLVNVLGVILGVAVASRDITIILAGGLAATFAESISMGAVAYTSTLARRDHYLSEVERERQEMRDLPDLERQEVREILERWDFQGNELDEMLERIVSKPKAWKGIRGTSEPRIAATPTRTALFWACVFSTGARFSSRAIMISSHAFGFDTIRSIISSSSSPRKSHRSRISRTSWRSRSGRSRISWRSRSTSLR